MVVTHFNKSSDSGNNVAGRFNFSNCRNCGQLFTARRERSSYCLECHEIFKEPMRKVKDYISFNPGSNAMEVVEATGVDFTLVQSFMRQGIIGIDLSSTAKSTMSKESTRVKKPVIPALAR